LEATNWLAKDMKSIKENDINELSSIALDQNKSLSECGITNGATLVVCWSTTYPSKTLPKIKPYPQT